MLALAHLFQLATAESFAVQCVFGWFWGLWTEGPSLLSCTSLPTPPHKRKLSALYWIIYTTTPASRPCSLNYQYSELETESIQPSDPKPHSSSTVIDNHHFFLTSLSILVSSAKPGASISSPFRKTMLCSVTFFFESINFYWFRCGWSK